MLEFISITHDGNGIIDCSSYLFKDSGVIGEIHIGEGWVKVPEDFIDLGKGKHAYNSQLCDSRWPITDWRIEADDG